MMQQTIQQRNDTGRVGKDFVPFFERTIRCQNDGLTFITTVDDFVKQIGRLVVEGEIPDFINKCSAEHFVTNVKLPEMWS